ncbi:hypothetical protein ACFSQE_08780 [Vogesella fluminis]|uniref:hypothetical protein n=1 Tax=Vogesella fluminis TaxID=1069161 RepID=UPI00363F5A1D
MKTAGVSVLCGRHYNEVSAAGRETLTARPASGQGQTGGDRIMTSLYKQRGWYNGVYLFTAVLVLVLFMSQPWLLLLLLLLLAALAGAGIVVGIAHGGHYLRQWLRQHPLRWH